MVLQASVKIIDFFLDNKGDTVGLLMFFVFRNPLARPVKGGSGRVCYSF